MTPQQAAAAVKKKLKDLEHFRRECVPDIIGVEAVKHFNQSFVNEGFTDKAFKKWTNVKRRDPLNEWYGFSLDANSQKPTKETVKRADSYRHATSKKDKSAKKRGNTNFSPTRAKDKILHGDSMELKNSIKYIKKTGRVTVSSDKPYASVHQFGEPANIFGRKSFTMIARPFIGKSEVLMYTIYSEIKKGIKKIQEQ